MTCKHIIFKSICIIQTTSPLSPMLQPPAAPCHSLSLPSIITTSRSSSPWGQCGMLFPQLPCPVPGPVLSLWMAPCTPCPRCDWALRGVSRLRALGETAGRASGKWYVWIARATGFTAGSGQREEGGSPAGSCDKPSMCTCICTPAFTHMLNIYMSTNSIGMYRTHTGAQTSMCAYMCAEGPHGWTDIIIPLITATTLVSTELIHKMANAARLYAASSPLIENHHRVHWSWCGSSSHFKIVTAHFPFLSSSLHVLCRHLAAAARTRAGVNSGFRKTHTHTHTHFTLILIHLHAWTDKACLSWWECVINVLWRGASAEWQWKTTYWLLILPVNVAAGHGLQACFSSGGWMGESYAERQARKTRES